MVGPVLHVSGAQESEGSDGKYKYARYAAQISGACLGYVFKVKESLKNKIITDPAKFQRLNKFLSTLAKTTPDPDYQTLPTITHDAQAKSLVHETVLKMEAKVREIQRLAKSVDETDKKHLMTLSQSVFRGRYIVRLIANTYRGVPAHE